MRLKPLHQRVVAIVFGLLGVSFAFQNCKGFNAQSLSANSDLASTSTPTTLPIPVTTLPLTDNSLISAKTAGTTDPNCLSNNTFDACIFWKNPVAQRGAIYPNLGLLFGQNLAADQTFGVKLKNLKSPSFLESDRLYIYTSIGTLADDPAVIRTKPRLQLNNGQYRANYSTDGNATSGSKSVAQLMAYFWLDHMATEFTRRVGAAVYPKQEITYVDAYSQDPDQNIRPYLIQNAFFTFSYCDRDDGSCGKRFDVGFRWIYMGFNIVCTQTDTAGNCIAAAFAHEMALSSEVYLHEMGHGNFLARVGAQSIIADTLSACPTAQGCLGAINEGQADFHSAMIFVERAQLGETMANNLTNGIDASRNPQSAANQARSVQQFFNLRPQVPGEIHDMGAAYAAILWRIYSDQRIEKRRFESAFFLHMQMLTQSATFGTSWAGLKAQYLAVGGNATGVQAIDDAFSQKGVVP